MLRRLPHLAAMSLLMLSCSKENAVSVDQTAASSVKNLGMACDASKDDGFCGAGACVAGLCRVKCETDAACEAGSICITEPSTKLGGCRLPSEAECTTSCPSALLKCGVDGTCRSPCTDKVACPRADQKCVEGTCFSGGDCTKEQLGTFKCDGASLQVCGASWTTVETCASAGLCQASLSSGKCATPKCSAGEASCNGATLKVCNADRTDFEEKKCETESLCKQGLSTAQCAPAACDAGEKKCEDAVLRTCNADRTGFDLGAQCASAALCQQGIASGTCPAPACQPNERKCEGNVLKVCNASRTGFDTQATCGTPELCTAGLMLGACKDAVCQPGELACDGPFLLACNDGQTGWATKYTCDSQSLCQSTIANAGGQIPAECTPAACKPGEYHCVGAELQACKYDQSAFVPVATCASAPLCDKGTLIGACPLPACEPGDAQCNGAKLLECNKDQTGYVETATCYSEALCNQGRTLQPPACMPDTCQTGKCDGNVMAPCRADGTSFVALETCATHDLCLQGVELPYINPNTAEIEHYGECVTPACAPYEVKMTNAAGIWTVSQCNTGQTDWNTTVCKFDQIPLCTGKKTLLSTCDPSVPNFMCCVDLIKDVTPIDPSTTIVCDAPFTSTTGMVSVTTGTGKTFRIDAYPVSNREYGDWAATKVSSLPSGTAFTFDTSGLPQMCAQTNMLIHDPASKPGLTGPYQKAGWCEAYAFCAARGRRLCGKVPDGGTITGAELNVVGMDEWFHVCSQEGSLKYSYGETYSQTACDPLAFPDTTCTGQKPPFNTVHWMSAGLREWTGTCVSGICLRRADAQDNASGSPDVTTKCTHTNNRSWNDYSGAIRCCANE